MSSVAVNIPAFVKVHWDGQAFFVNINQVTVISRIRQGELSGKYTQITFTGGGEDHVVVDESPEEIMDDLCRRIPEGARKNILLRDEEV